jgi:hypothetical protein
MPVSGPDNAGRLRKTFSNVAKEAQTQLKAQSSWQGIEDGILASSAAVKVADALEKTNGWDESLSRSAAMNTLQDLFELVSDRSEQYIVFNAWEGRDAADKLASVSGKIAIELDVLKRADR